MEKRYGNKPTPTRREIQGARLQARQGVEETDLLVKSKGVRRDHMVAEHGSNKCLDSVILRCGHGVGWTLRVVLHHVLPLRITAEYYVRMVSRQDCQLSPAK